MPTDETVRDIIRIEMLVEAACLCAQDDLKPGSREAINWGDLHCAEVWAENDGYSVRIEEASPTAYALIQFVTDRLVEAGFTNIDVSTEW